VCRDKGIQKIVHEIQHYITPVHNAVFCFTRFSLTKQKPDQHKRDSTRHRERVVKNPLCEDILDLSLPSVSCYCSYGDLFH
jgi:hypothetical protein